MNIQKFTSIKKILFLALLSIGASHSFAQSSNGIFFQAVARDNFSNPAKDRNIYVQSTIVQNTTTGTKVLIETHKSSTDAMGVFNITIGNGQRTGGTANSIAAIDWSKGPFYLNLKIAITPLSASDNWDYTKELVDIGTTSFGAVPFAFYSASSAKVDDKLNATDTTKMLAVYAKAIKVQSIESSLATKLTAADTLTMLAPYAKAAYTIDSNFFRTQLATKFNTADTINYTKRKYTDSAISKKLNMADSSIYVTPAKLASYNFSGGGGITTDTSSLSNRINLKANASDITSLTNTLGSKLNLADSTKYVTPTQLASYNFSGGGTTIDTSSLSNRINLKANAADVANAIATATSSINTNTTAIGSLNTTVANNTANISSNTTSITAEAATARAAELTLTNNITTNTSNIATNTTAISNLNTSVTTNTANINSNTTAIGSLNTNVAANTASITSLTSNTIPYTGARASVNLGAYDLKVNGLTIGLGAGSFTNTVVGYNALASNTSGYYNNAFGYLALLNNTTGFSNTAIGAGGLMNNTVGYSNLAIGAGSLMNNIDGNSNLAIGIQSLNSNNSGFSNTGIGSGSLFTNTTGNWNVGLGTNSLYYNQTGSYNFAIGSSSLYKNIDGNNNVSIGNKALFENLHSNNNVAIGAEALLNSLGEGNIAIGTSSLAQNYNGAHNTAIGYYSDVTADNIQNSTAIGFSALVNTSNTIQLGNPDITNVKTSGTLTLGTVTYPKIHGTNGQVLSTTGTGSLIWATAAVPSDASSSAKGLVQLAGDLGGTSTAPTVTTVGGVSASTISNYDTRINVATSSITANTTSINNLNTNVVSNISSINALNTTIAAATNSNTANTIVKRDASGNFSAGTINATTINTPIYASSPQVLTDGATISWNPTLGLNASVTLAGNRTLSFFSTPVAGSYGTLVVTQDGTGGRTLTLPSTSNLVLGSSATTTIALSTAANAKDILNFYYDGTNCYWNIGQGYGAAATAPFSLTTTGTGAATLSGTTLNIPSVSSTVNAGSISGTIAVANGGTGATTLTGLVKGNGSGAFTAAVSGTDYLLPTGNAATATLATTATTAGNITATSNTTLTSLSNLNTVGTITSGTISVTTNIKTSSTLTAGTVTYPNTHGTSGQVLSTTGSGTLTWATTAAPSDASTSVKGIVQLAGDLAGTASLPTVNTVGGVSSSTIGTINTTVTAATNNNTVSTIVKRDASGNFSAGTITANLNGNVTGNLTGNATTATTASSVSGTVAIANGGTNATTAANALTNLGAAPLSSPIFTNIPQAPTAIAGTNNTQLATTAFVTTAVAAIAVRITSEEYTATAGQTAFTILQTPLSGVVWMFVNGTRIKNGAYTVSGKSITYNPTNNNSYTLVLNDRIQFDYAY